MRATFGPVSFGVTGFANYYDNFIDQVTRGTNPATGLLELQYQNVAEVENRGIEFQGDARLTESLRLRASCAAIRADNVSGDADVPLASIAPNQGAIGLGYATQSGRWGNDPTVRAVRGGANRRRPPVTDSTRPRLLPWLTSRAGRR